MRRLLFASALALTAALAGCRTVYHGALDDTRHEAADDVRRIVLLPFDNATSDPAAARAVRDFVASAMAERGLRFRQTEESLLLAARKNAAGDTGLYPEIARAAGARYFVTGSVHEYRYMADLEGSPAVSFSLRLVDARDGRTLWHGTAANTGYGWKSLGELSAESARAIARKLPLAMRDAKKSPARVCLRTGKPALYTLTREPDTYEVDTLDGSLSYTVEIKGGTLPPLHAAVSEPVIATPPAPAEARPKS